MDEGRRLADSLRERVFVDLTQALLYAIVVALFALIWIVLRRRGLVTGLSREATVTAGVVVLSVAIGVIVIGLVGALLVPGSAIPG